jgi:anti-anti-sigma factor
MSSSIQCLPETAKTIRLPGYQAESLLATEIDDEVVTCDLLLDFADVEHVNATELRMLLKLHRKLEAGGGMLTVANLKPRVSEAFHLAGLHRVLSTRR